MDTIFTILSLIIISYLFSFLLKKYMKIPKVVSLIILGVLFGSTQFGDIFINNSKETIATIGSWGIFSLMFLAGLESSYKTLIKEEKDSVFIALYGTFITLILGFLVFYLFFGFNAVQSFVIGLCLSITAEGTKARVLMEFNKLKSKVGTAMLGAGIIGDLVGLLLFTFLLIHIGVFDFHEHFMLVGILVAFTLGLLTQHFFCEHHLTKKIEVFFTYFIIPFFFINMGSNFDLSILFADIKLFLILFLVGTLGKLFGTFMSWHDVSFSLKQLHLIGWGMNSRGAVEIAIALIALQSGIISSELFSGLVLTALFSTLVFPFVLEYMLSKDKKIMD